MSEKRVFGRRRYFSFVPPAAGMFIWVSDVLPGKLWRCGLNREGGDARRLLMFPVAWKLFFVEIRVGWR
jgi:hypothetical protein